MQHTEQNALSFFSKSNPSERPVPDADGFSALASAIQVSFPAKSFIDLKETITNPIGLISEGTVGFQHNFIDGRKSISSLFFANDMLDFRLTEKVFGVFVCYTPVVLTLVKVEEIKRLYFENPQILETITNSYLNSWSDGINHKIDLACKSATERLASFILQCNDHSHDNRKGTVNLVLKRIDMADYLGLRPETLSRAFATLKSKNLIDVIDADDVRIQDLGELTKMASGKACILKI